MNELKLKAYAKINLALDVIGKRTNGYHELRMIMQQIDVYDELTFEKTEETGFTLSCNKDTIPTDESNLIIKVCKLMFEKFSLPGGMKIHLEKSIPMAAGLAGGSTDGAATFKAINEMYSLNLSEDELCEMGVKLGADIPYCIVGGTQLSEGIGEVLTPVNNKLDPFVLLVKPDVNVSTKYVYESLHMESNPKFDVDVDMCIDGLQNGDWDALVDGMGNALATVTEAECPRIEEIKNAMMGCGATVAMMSGSGPSVFGLFEDRLEAEYAYTHIRNQGKEKEIFITRFI